MATLSERIAVLIDADASGAVQALDKGSAGAKRFDAETTAAARHVKLALLGVGVAATGLAITSVSKFREVGAEVKALSRLTGDSVEQSSRLRFAAHGTGVEINTLATGVRTLEKHLAANDDQVKSLGINFRTASGQIRPFASILDDIADRFATMPDGPEKTALAVNLFGRSGASLIPLLNKGSAGLKSMGDEAQRLGLVLDTGAIEGIDAATKASRDLEASIDAVQVAIGRRALPVVTQLKQLAADGLGFVAAHKETATAAAEATLAASAFGTLGGAAANLNEIVTAGTLLLSKWRTRTAVVENTALAASYDKVAASATAAAVAETGAATAGVGGGIAGGTTANRKRGSMLLAGGGTLGAVAAVATLGPSYFSTGQGLAQGRAPSGPLGYASLASPITYTGAAVGGLQRAWHGLFGGGGPSDEEVKAQKDAAQAARENTAALIDAMNATRANTDASLKEFRQRVALANRANALERKGRAAARSVDDTDLFAALPTKPDVDLAGLHDRVSNAADSVATAQDRLNTLRASGKADADQLAAAERGVARAQRSADAAARALAEGQDKANEKTALSARAVLNRAQANTHAVRQQLKAEQELVDRGLSSRALKSVQALERDAPGTARKLAKTLTDEEIKQLNSDAYRRQKALEGLASLPDDAKAARIRAREWRLAGRQAATEFGKGWRERFPNLPLFQAGFSRGNPGPGRPPAEHRARDDRRDGLLREIARNTRPSRGTNSSPGYS